MPMVGERELWEWQQRAAFLPGPEQRKQMVEYEKFERWAAERKAGLARGEQQMLADWGAAAEGGLQYPGMGPSGLGRALGLQLPPRPRGGVPAAVGALVPFRRNQRAEQCSPPRLKRKSDSDPATWAREPPQQAFKEQADQLRGFFDRAVAVMVPRGASAAFCGDLLEEYTDLVASGRELHEAWTEAGNDAIATGWKVRLGSAARVMINALVREVGGPAVPFLNMVKYDTIGDMRSSSSAEGALEALGSRLREAQREVMDRAATLAVATAHQHALVAAMQTAAGRGTVAGVLNHFPRLPPAPPQHGGHDFGGAGPSGQQQVCRLWQRSGDCKWGAKCKWASSHIKM